MKSRTFKNTLTVAHILILSLNLLVAVNAQSQPARYSPFAVAVYSESRAGYERPPLQIAGLRGGKPGANEKLRIEVTMLKNQTAKQAKAIKFKAFIFDNKDLNDALETVETPLVELEIPAFGQLNREILILYGDDVPLLAYQPGAQFRLEVAVAEIHFNDGFIWQAKNLPGKLDPGKAP
ncbi:MAG: hypothetical protein ACRD8U_24395 [Pyrinomonadaceae bacterium]